MVRIPTDREPTHPGEMLLNEFLLPTSMTQHALAGAIRRFCCISGVSRADRVSYRSKCDE